MDCGGCCWKSEILRLPGGLFIFVPRARAHIYIYVCAMEAMYFFRVMVGVLGDQERLGSLEDFSSDFGFLMFVFVSFL